MSTKLDLEESRRVEPNPQSDSSLEEALKSISNAYLKFMLDFELHSF